MSFHAKGLAIYEENTIIRISTAVRPDMQDIKKERKDGRRMKHMGKCLVALLLAIAMLITLPVTEVSAKKAHALGNTVTNQLLGARTAEYEGRIYYGIYNKIYSVKKDGTKKKEIYTVKDGEGANGFSSIAVYDGYIYALYDSYGGSDGIRDKLIRVKLDGSGYKSFGYASTVAVVDGKIYYTKAELETDECDNLYLENMGIYSMNPDGSGKKAIIKKKGITILSADWNRIYYKVYDYKTGKTSFYHCDTKGKNKKKLVTIANSNSRYALSGDNFFYSEEKTADKGIMTYIYRLNMKTGKKTKVHTSTDLMTNFYVDGNTLYTASYNDGLKKVNLSSKKESTLVKGPMGAINGIHGSVMVYSKYKEELTAMILAKKSTGKKIREIGTYFVS